MWTCQNRQSKYPHNVTMRGFSSSWIIGDAFRLRHVALPDLASCKICICPTFRSGTWTSRWREFAEIKAAVDKWLVGNIDRPPGARCTWAARQTGLLQRTHHYQQKRFVGLMCIIWTRFPVGANFTSLHHQDQKNPQTKLGHSQERTHMFQMDSQLLGEHTWHTIMNDFTNNKCGIRVHYFPGVFVPRFALTIPFCLISRTHCRTQFVLL